MASCDNLVLVGVQSPSEKPQISQAFEDFQTAGRDGNKICVRTGARERTGGKHMYVLGVDAGGTKTHCAVADETGRIVGEGFSGPANHQTCGRERTKQSLQEAVGKALSAAGLEKKDITCGVFGMSGADGEDDFILLNDVVGEIMGNVSFEVMHDGWIGFRSAVDGNMGVVSICGTGAGHAGENRRGEHLTLRNLD